MPMFCCCHTSDSWHVCTDKIPVTSYVKDTELGATVPFEIAVLHRYDGV